MLEFLDRCWAELGDALVDGFYQFVRTALTTAHVLNGICYLIAATSLFGLAIFLVLSMGDRVPAADVGAFLIAWWALALAIHGLEQLARTEPQKTFAAGRPSLRENRAVEDRKAAVLSMLLRRDSGKPEELSHGER